MLNGSGRSRMPSTSEKMAVVAPMPRARARTMITVKPGAFSSWRNAKRRSCVSPCMFGDDHYAAVSSIGAPFVITNVCS